MLCRRRDRPVSVTSPALELFIIQAAALTSPIGRRLTETESKLVFRIFEQSVDRSRVRVVEASIANAPTTLGNQIRVTPGFDFDTEEGKATLIHEMAHIWQYQTRGTAYITDAAYHQATAHFGTGTRNAAYFNYTLDPGRSISEYTAEEQATIIEDYYQLTIRYAGTTPVPEWVNVRRPLLPRYEDLMRQVRSATPMLETTIYERNLMVVPGFDSTGTPGLPDDRGTAIVPLLRFSF